MSAIRPGEYGWNILHLKWPYFQAVAHRETQPHHVRTGHAARRARRRAARSRPRGAKRGHAPALLTLQRRPHRLRTHVFRWGWGKVTKPPALISGLQVAPPPLQK